MRSLSLLLLAGGACAAPEADILQELPGWGAPLFSRTYAGYISAGQEDGKKMHEHYLFFESEGDPKADPLIMWTNGGPGASSFFGAFSELGPYYLSDASLQTQEYKATGVPTLFENIFRWTKLGNLLIRNLPPPVGFSYCDPPGPAGDGTSCGSWNDTKTAKHSVQFMENWMAAFPEYATHDLFLVGESYAGIYVPTLAREILNAGGSLAAQLKGIAVGDGCLGGSAGCTPFTGPLFDVEFFHGHGQFSEKTYAEIKASCPQEELLNGVHSPACKAALDRMDKEKGYSFDYNLYDECYDFDLSGLRRWHENRTWWGPPLKAMRRQPQQGLPEPVEWHMDGTPCGGSSVLLQWVNASAVKKALHVAEDAYFFSGDNGQGFVYNTTEPSLVPWYKTVAENTGLRILIYNGDADPGLNTFYAQYWTSSVGLSEVQAWRPWTRDGKIKMGGYVTRYEHDFDFLTIRGSGHMVPEYKPEAASVLLKSFLHGVDYPQYQPELARQEFLKSAQPPQQLTDVIV